VMKSLIKRLMNSRIPSPYPDRPKDLK
jgi:hypothetical protein